MQLVFNYAGYKTCQPKKKTLFFWSVMNAKKVLAFRNKKGRIANNYDL